MKHEELKRSVMEHLLGDDAAEGSTSFNNRRSPESPMVDVFWTGSSEDRKTVEHTFRDLWPMDHTEIPKAIVPGKDDNPDDICRSIRNRCKEMQSMKGLKQYNRLVVVSFVSLDFMAEDEFARKVFAISSMEKPTGVQTVCHAICLFCGDEADSTERLRREISAIFKKVSEYDNTCLIVLSRFLNGGRRLSDEDVSDNYRAAALVTALANTTAIASDLNDIWSEVFARNTAITVCYRPVRKPAEHIAHLLLRNVADRRIEMAEEDDKRHRNNYDHSPDKLIRLMGVDRGLKTLEKYFAETACSRLPVYDDFALLPNWKKAKKAEDWQAADRETCGCLDAFAQRYFRCCASQTELQELASQARMPLKEKLCKEVDFEFIRNHDYELRKAISGIMPIPVTDDAKYLYRKCLEEAKATIYEGVKPELENMVGELYRKSNELRDRLAAIREHFVLLQAPVQEGLTDVNEFYEKVIRDELDTAGEVLLRQINLLCEDGIEEQVYKATKAIIEENPEVYLGSFEDEIQQRVKNPEQKNYVVRAMSVGDFDQEYRIGVKGVTKIRKYCIVNGEAGFIDQLPDDYGTTVRISGNNRAERLAIVRFNPDDIC